MEAYCVDIGLIGDRGTYGLHVGGAASGQQLRAVKVASGLSAAGTIPLIERVLGWYEEQALDGERLHKTLERLGAGEARERTGTLFAEAARAFEGVQMGDDVVRMLERKLARSCGARRMQVDLGLPPGP
jgi:NAD(P)H-nitrite reductase large subunit